MDTILVIVFGTIVLVSLYILYRNQRVFNFRNEIIEMVFRFEGDWRKRNEIFHKFSYDSMVCSLKKLKLESYWSKEDVNILINH